MRITVTHLLLVLVAGIFNRTFAQKVYRVPNSQRYFIGIKAGVLSSWPVFTDPDLKQKFSSTPVAGFNVGALVNFPLKKTYSFQTEFGFSQMGRKVTFNSDYWTNTSTYHFLDFSMALRRSFNLKISKNIPSNWYINVGPNIKYWMGGKGTVATTYGPPQSYTIEFDKTSSGEYDKMFYNNVNRWIFGLEFGLGANVGTIKGQQVMAELRFTYGQTHLGNKGSASSQSINILGFEDSLECNLKVLSLSLAYTIDFFTGQSKMGKSTFEKNKKKNQ